MPESSPFLQAAGVGLHVLNEGDARAISEWINAPSVRKFSPVSLPTSEAARRRWISELYRADAKDVAFGIVAPDRNFVGVIVLKDISYPQGTAEIITVIGRSDYWDRGIGFIARMMMLHYGFVALGLRKVRSRMSAFNTRSRRCGEKCGYHEEGVLKAESYRNGAFEDMVLMAVFKEDWLPLWERFQRDESIISLRAAGAPVS